MHRRPCWVDISTGALEDNYRTLAESCRNIKQQYVSGQANDLPPIELLAIVKADAYGHGLSACAPAVVRAGARWLGVTSVEEGVAARGLCPDAEILIIGGVFRGQGAEAIAHRLTSVVWETWQLEELESAARAASCASGSVPAHLEFDTGMSRQGVSPSELDNLLSQLVDSPLRLDGLMTHLYAADESDGDTTAEQLKLLDWMVERVFAAGLRPEWLHVGNSAALLTGSVPRQLGELCARTGLRPMMRPGVALYGLAPEFVPEEPERAKRLRSLLRPVLEWKTQVVSVRSIEPGHVVGYNGSFVATEAMLLGLLAVGYGDGLKRALSNLGHVLVSGCRAPIVGRVSMDQTVVDLTGIPQVAAGDEVVLLGSQGVETITVKDHAAWAGTIPWEIWTSIAARVERRSQ